MRRKKQGTGRVGFNPTVYNLEELYEKLGRHVIRLTQKKGIEVKRFVLFNGDREEAALYEVRKEIKMPKKKKRQRPRPNKRGEEGFGLLELVVALGLMGLIIVGFSSYVRVNLNLMAQERHRVEALLEELANATSNIPKHCAAGDLTCVCNQPSLCLHDHANGKTTQACEDDCVKVGANWEKGGQVCTRGIYCIGS